MYTIITENDESQWDDETGELYHFPNKYVNLLKPGTKIIYYKGRMTNKRFSGDRLMHQPHYFGVGTIGEVVPVPGRPEQKAKISDFQMFVKGVLAKNSNKYYEEIPKSLEKNYWRNGVRRTTKAVFDSILKSAILDKKNPDYNDQESDQFTTTIKDGKKRLVYTTVYERNKKNRDQAIHIHGYTCIACGFNFKETYGDWGEGYIHVHHNKPLHIGKDEVDINPKSDLSVVCANCHSMIHRKKNVLLTIEELINIIKRSKK